MGIDLSPVGEHFVHHPLSVHLSRFAFAGNTCFLQKTSFIWPNSWYMYNNIKFMQLSTFQEEGDIEYKSEDSESDETDSDISIDENDELKSDDEDDDKKRKKKGVVTKAYKVCAVLYGSSPDTCISYREIRWEGIY